MQEDLRKRREETFDMLVIKGYEYRRVVDTLAERYDVTPAAIEKDIGRMTDWLPRLAWYDDDDGAGRLLELKKNRQRLHQMATEARSEGDTALELKIRRRIDKAIEADIKLSQSLGQTHEAPDRHEVSGPDGGSIEFTMIRERYDPDADDTDGDDTDADAAADGDDTDEDQEGGD